MIALTLGCASSGSGDGDPSDGSLDATSSASEHGSTDDDETAADTDASADTSAGEADTDESTDDGSTTGARDPESPCPGGPSEFPLEITSPKTIGDAPDGLDPEHRVYRAYPGLAYDIRVAAVGGEYPFSYALSNAPDGMTIDASTGEIRWPDPRASAADITVTVTDSGGATDSQTWSITVGTAGFHFVDAIAGQSDGDGTLASPWRTLADVYAMGLPDGIVIFRGGEGAVYGLDGIPVENADTDEERIDFEEQTRPVIWLGHPDDSPRPVIDYGYTGEGDGAVVPRIRIGGHNVYIDNLETMRSYRMAFQVGRDGGHGSTFRRLYMHDTGPGLDGNNSAFIMYITCEGCESYGDIVQDVELANIDNGTGNCGLKLYAMDKPLIADNLVHDTGASMEVIAIKAGILQFDVRGNTFWNVGGNAIGGNMHYERTSGEIRFNNVRAADTMALRLNQDGMAGSIHVYRNTLQGRVQVDSVDTVDGPFSFNNNVIVNDDADLAPLPHFYFQEVVDALRITSTDDITGVPADGIVDAEGELQGASLQYLGTHGHALGSCE